MAKTKHYLLAACLGGYLIAAVADPRPTVVDALRALTATGVEVLYSSELVAPDLDAPAVPPGSNPLTRAVQALAAHHLELRRTGPGRYLVTRAGKPPAPAVADTTVIANRTLRSTEIDGIAVFASRYAFTDEATGESVDYDERRIAQVPGAQADVVRALRTAPGLATNLSARPYVRGALLDDILVLFDGIPLIDPFHFKNFQNLISTFDPAAVDRAEVYTGGFPVKYGTRSGGVLDLTPRSADAGSEYGVGASLLSYNLQTVGHAERWPIEWLLTARHNADQSTLQPIVGEFGEPTFSDSIGRVRWQIGPASAVTAGWLFADDKVNLSSRSREEHATGRSRDLHAWLVWDWSANTRVRSHSAIALSGSERRVDGYLSLPGIATGSLDEERRFSTAELRTAWTYAPTAASRWEFGAEFTLENAELDFSRRELLGEVASAAFGRSADVTVNYAVAPHSSTLGLYASGHRRWQDLEAEIGLRLDGQDYHGFGARRQLSPRLNLRYDLTSFWHLYGSWGYFTQAQRVDEYRSEGQQSTPDAASRAVHLIAGVDYHSLGDIDWRLEAYRNHWSSISSYFDNVLSAVSLLPALEPDRVLVTPASAEAKGVELSARETFAEHMNVYGTYTLASVSDDVHGQDTARSWDQSTSATIGLAWSQARTSASILLGWHSGWPKTPLTIVPAAAVSAPAYLVVGARNSARWPAYFSADLRLSRTVSLNYGELSLWIDATNVTNQANRCCIDLNSTGGGNIELLMSNEIWSPRAVNVGFVWRVRRSR